MSYPPAPPLPPRSDGEPPAGSGDEGPDEVFYDLDFGAPNGSARGSRASDGARGTGSPRTPGGADGTRNSGQSRAPHRLRTLAITGLVVVLIGGGFAAFQSSRDAPDPVVSPTPSQTPTPTDDLDDSGGLFIPPDPVGPPAPAPPRPAPGDAVDPSRFLTAPDEAWSIRASTLDLPGGAVTDLRPATESADLSRNSSDVIVLLARQEQSLTLLGIDTRDGSQVWTSRDARDAADCAVLAGGHQLGCVSTSESAGHITVFDTASGAVLGTMRAAGRCIPVAVGGSSDNLIVVGMNVFDQPCFFRGPLGGEAVAALTAAVDVPGSAETADTYEDPDSFASPNALTIYDDALQFKSGSQAVFVTPDLTSVIATSATDEWSWVPGIGTVTSVATFDHKGGWAYDHGFETTTERFTVPGAPWTVLPQPSSGGSRANVVGAGNALYGPDGSELWSLKALKERQLRDVLVAGQTALVLERTSLDEEGHSFSLPTLTARSMSTGARLWEVGPDLGGSQPQVDGNAAVWIEAIFVADEESATTTIVGMDLRDGSIAWSRVAPSRSTHNSTDPFSLAVGDTLVYVAEDVISGYRP